MFLDSEQILFVFTAANFEKSGSYWKTVGELNENS